jgi:hypothetical protein
VTFQGIAVTQNSNQQTKQNVSVHYDKTEVLYATQFVASPSAEELLLDFSSGTIREPGSGDESLRIHTRLAMPWSTVERLSRILNQVVERKQQLVAKQTAVARQAAANPSVPQASLPQMSQQPTG